MKSNLLMMLVVSLGFSMNAIAMQCDLVTYTHQVVPNEMKLVVDGEIPETIESLETHYTKIDQVTFSESLGRLNCPTSIEVSGSRIELDPNHNYGCIYSRPEMRAHLDGKIRCR